MNTKVKTNQPGVAPLRNLAILDTLAVRVMERPDHLPGLATFSGPSGYGKSTAAAYVTARRGGTYLEIRSTWTKKAFLTAWLGSMGLTPKKTVCEMVDQVADELATSQNITILDEFDNAVSRDLVEMVRDIYEQSKAPIILIGEELLPQKLQKWERFHGRIMDWARAEPVNVADAQTLNRHYSSDVTVDKDLLTLLISQSRGSVRRVVTNLERIFNFARGEGLSQIGCKEWGNKELHTANPPQARKF